MRLVFFGSGAFGLPTLSALAREHEILLVVSQPDRPAGRRRRMTPTPIAQEAEHIGLGIIKPEIVNDVHTIETIRAKRAEAFVVIAYGQKLDQPLLEGVFALNLHGSLLPKFRGAAPINWAVIQGESHTGLSVITLAQRMDAGAILAQCSTPIDPLETAGELHDRLAQMGPALVSQTLADHARGRLQPRPQDEAKATHAPRLTRTDGTVSFDQPARAVQRRIHGLTPWPGCVCRMGVKQVRLHRVDALEERGESEEPGLVRPDRSIACRSGSIRVLQVQPPGARLMTFEEYCRGHDVMPGTRVETG